MYQAAHLGENSIGNFGGLSLAKLGFDGVCISISTYIVECR